MSRLAVPSEPARLRPELRALAGEDPLGARPEIARRLSDRLWRLWRPELAPRGGTPGALRTQVLALGYETWLWVMGDRPWDQLVEALAGRVERRLPPPAALSRR